MNNAISGTRALAALSAIAFATTLSATAVHAQDVDLKSEDYQKLVEAMPTAKHTLYAYDADYRGAGDYAASSRCNDACAATWLPVVSAKPAIGQGDVQAELIGTMQRNDFKRQVTYAGWPLYLLKDEPAGQVGGQGKAGPAGKFFLLSPAGEPAK